MRRLWPMIVPVVACLAVVSVRPAGQFAPPERRWLIDDVDCAGRILRGLNAWQGRLAGRAEEPPGVEFVKFHEHLHSVDRLEPRYFLEYPQGALLCFAAVGPKMPFVPGDAKLSPALLDSLYHNLAHYEPQTDDERFIWRQFSRSATDFNLLFLVVLLGVMWFNRRQPIVLLALPAAVYFSLHRYDILPSAMVLLALHAAVKRRSGLAGLFLGLAVMLKAYPLILAPILLRFLATSWKSVIAFLIGIAIPIATLLGYSLAIGDWTAVIEPYRYQLSRPADPGSGLFGSLLPLAWGGAEASKVRSAIVLLAVVFLCVRPAVDGHDLARRCGLAVLLFMAMQVFYSEQWLLWLTPLLLPLAAKSRILFWLLVAFDLISYLSFPIAFDFAPSLRFPLILARVLIWLGIAATLIAGLGQQQDHHPRQPE